MDDRGCTALHWARVYGHTDTARLLIQRRVVIDVMDDCGNTALT